MALNLNAGQNVADVARKGFQHEGIGYVFNEESGQFEAKKIEDPPTNNENNDAPKPRDFQAWIAEAPPEVVSVVQNALSWEQAQKDDCIKVILANESNKMPEAELKKMSLPVLQNFAALAKKEEAASSNDPGDVIPLFMGANTPDRSSVTNKNKETNNKTEDPLLLPNINWAEDEKKD